MTPLRCYLCGHEFDTSFQVHCKCRACGKSISVVDANRAYRMHHALHQGVAPAINPTAPPRPTSAPARDPDAGLGPAARDKDGKPLPKPAAPPPPAERPRYASEDFSFIARRAQQLRKERDERVASGEGEELL